MKRLVIAAIPFFVAGIAHAGETLVSDAAATPQTPAAASTPDDPPVTLDSLLNPVSKASSGVTALRSQMLTDAGKTVGFRGGMAARARELTDALKARSDRLDTIFQFAPLINKNGMVSPVIVEARDLSAFAPDQIRTANRAYKIEKEERFVSVPPTWRDYLFVGLPAKGNVELPAFEARPQDSGEETIWREAVKVGWKEGQLQADAILAANFNRLTRDYAGMLLYSTLLQQGMISATRVAEYQQAVTGDGKQIMLGDKLRRVTNKASFETDPNKWRPAVNRGQASASKSAQKVTSAASKQAGADGK